MRYHYFISYVCTEKDVSTTENTEIVLEEKITQFSQIKEIEEMITLPTLSRIVVTNYILFLIEDDEYIDDFLATPAFPATAKLDDDAKMSDTSNLILFKCNECTTRFEVHKSKVRQVQVSTNEYKNEADCPACDAVVTD